MNVTGPLRGGRLYCPVAVKVTCPLGKVDASAPVGVTVMAVKTRKELGFDELQESRVSAYNAIADSPDAPRQTFIQETSFSGS